MKELNEMSLNELFDLIEKTKEAIEMHPDRKYCPSCKTIMTDKFALWECPKCTNSILKLVLKQ